MASAVNLASMRLHVRKPVGIPVDDPDLTDAELDYYLNASYWEVQDKFPFREKERSGTFLTVIGNRNYEVPTPVEAITGVAINRDTDNQHIPLDQMDARETELLFNEQTTMYGLPEKYLIENCYIRFWPVPDKVYTVTLRKNTILGDIEAAGIAIPNVWIEIVEAGAIYRAFKGQGDMSRAIAYRNDQASMLNAMVPREQKEKEADYQFAGVQVYGRSYEIQ